MPGKCSVTPNPVVGQEQHQQAQVVLFKLSTFNTSGISSLALHPSQCNLVHTLIYLQGVCKQLQWASSPANTPWCSIYWGLLL